MASFANGLTLKHSSSILQNIHLRLLQVLHLFVCVCVYNRWDFSHHCTVINRNICLLSVVHVYSALKKYSHPLTSLDFWWPTPIQLHQMNDSFPGFCRVELLLIQEFSLLIQEAEMHLKVALSDWNWATMFHNKHQQL